MDILQACRDENLFAPWFEPSEEEGGAPYGERNSYLLWTVFLSSLFALPLSPEQLKIYQTCTGRSTAPIEVQKEAWLICGRRSGKSFHLALIAVYLACFFDYRKHLAPGERGTIMVIASDKKQARVIMGYIGGFLENCPMLTKLVDRQLAEAIHLNNRISIEVQTASFRRVRGYTVVAALCDEIAFWRSEDSSNPDNEILDAIRPAMATIPNAMLLCASSPYARKGALWEAYNRMYGKDEAPALVWKASTREMNPTVPQRVIDEATERDPAHASAEYLANFRTDVEDFISREAVEACVVFDRRELPPQRQYRYAAFVDPSGGAHDSFTLAIAHREGDRENSTVILDLLRERRPPFSPESVSQEFAETMRKFRITKATSDRYAGQWPAEQFRKYGINIEHSVRPKSQLYLDLLPLINSRSVDLLENKTLVNQLCALERKTTRGGRDMVDHSPGAKDDVANAAAGALTSVPRAGQRDTRSTESRVILGYAKQKAHGRQHVAVSKKQEPEQMSKPLDDLFDEPAELESHAIGEDGYVIALREVAPDGREKWLVLSPTGEMMAAMWGRKTAEAAARELSETGTMTR